MNAFTRKCCGTLFKAALIGTVIAAFGASTPAMAISPGGTGVPWELDGNTADTTPSTSPYDWNDLYGLGTTPPPLGSNATTGIVVDTVNHLFTQGSKDIYDITGWTYTTQTAPPKADIRAAYAIRYTVSGDEIIYFGSDRGTTNGTTFSGYWFLQQSVNLGPNGKFVQADGTPAHHVNGDVLVAVAYDNGGHVGQIVIYEWQDGLVQVGSASNSALTAGLYCNLAKNGVDTTCGITNGSALTGNVPWRTGTLPAGIFFEGGIDFSALFTGTVPCFATFLATTRSSTSTTAEIKNFVLSQFGACGFSVTKTCDTTVLGNGNACALDPATGKNTCYYNGTVNNTGSGDLSVSLSDAFKDGDAGATTTNTTLSYVDCTSGTATNSATATVAGGATACYKGSYTTTSRTAVTDTITAQGTNGSFSATETADAACTPRTAEIDVEISKTCSVVLAPQDSVTVVQVNFSGQLDNNSTVNLSNVSISDSVNAAVTVYDCGTKETISQPFSMLHNSSVCYSGSYLPAATVTRGVCATYSDTASVTYTAAGSTVPTTQDSSSANCSLCAALSPGEQCPL